VAQKDVTRHAHTKTGFLLDSTLDTSAVKKGGESEREG
jgi:hypothetical protein